MLKEVETLKKKIFFGCNISNSFTSIISLTGLGCQSVDIAFKKQQIKIGFFLNLLGLLVNVQYSSRLGLLAIFSNLEFVKNLLLQFQSLVCLIT